MSNLRKLARGRPCMVRFEGICNGDESTTVLAHLRMMGISGMGIKAHDFLGAHCCAACHEYADTHADALTQRDFYQGIFRTQAALIKEGIVDC